MDKYSDAFVGYLQKIIDIDEPEKVKVSDVLGVEMTKTEESGITPQTKVKDIANAYPWMVEKLGEEFPETEKYIKNPITRKVVMGMTLDGVAKQVGKSFDEIKETLEKMIAQN